MVKISWVVIAAFEGIVTLATKLNVAPAAIGPVWFPTKGDVLFAGVVASVSWKKATDQPDGNVWATPLGSVDVLIV